METNRPPTKPKKINIHEQVILLTTDMSGF